MNFDLQAVAPSQGDKYSPNLYKWLCKHGAHDIRVFQHRITKALYVGYLFDGELVRAQLSSVLCPGALSDPFSSPATLFEEVPGFWLRYLEAGRCAIDTAHEQRFLEDNGRFIQDGETRTCQWCGAVQVLRRWQETVEREAWENQA